MSLDVYQCDECGAVTPEPGDDCDECGEGEMFEVYVLECSTSRGCGKTIAVGSLSEDNINWDTNEIECPYCNQPLEGC